MKRTRRWPSGCYLITDRYCSFGCYDDEDEFIELLQPLTQPEVDLIPKGLQKVMLKVVSSEEGLRLPGNFFVQIEQIFYTIFFQATFFYILLNTSRSSRFIIRAFSVLSR